MSPIATALRVTREYRDVILFLFGLTGVSVVLAIAVVTGDLYVEFLPIFAGMAGLPAFIHRDEAIVPPIPKVNGA